MWKLAAEKGIVIAPDGAFVSKDGHRWNEYQEWKSKGNKPDKTLRRESFFEQKKEEVRVKANKERDKPFVDPVSGKSFRVSIIRLLYKLASKKNTDLFLETEEFKADGVKKKKHKFKRNEFRNFVDYVIDQIEGIDDREESMIDQVSDIFIDQASDMDDIKNFDVELNW